MTLLACATAWLAAACGGTSGKSAESAADASDEAERESSWDEEREDGGEAGPSTPAGPDCSDGTCFECGDGLCPVGFYCDERAPGGPACSWLPECAEKATCSCVLGVLGSSCSCDDSDQGPRVSCE